MLRLARVAAVNPEDHSVDIVLVDDGSRYVGVQVLSPSASTDTGTADMPEPGVVGDKWSLSERRGRDILAVVSMLERTALPVVLGFLYPQVNGMLFADRERRVVRHASDVYTSVDANGNVELAHPNGTYIRIGTSPDHEDLTAKDFDGNWKIGKNVDRQTHFQLMIKAGGAQKAVLHIDPAGNVTLEHSGNLVVNTTGTAHVTAGGAATLTAPAVTIESPTTLVTGTLTVQGLLTYQAGLVGSGGTGASLTGALTVAGNVSTTGTVANNGKAVGSTHTHSGVQSGGSTSGPPT